MIRVGWREDAGEEAMVCLKPEALRLTFRKRKRTLLATSLGDACVDMSGESIEHLRREFDMCLLRYLVQEFPIGAAGMDERVTDVEVHRSWSWAV